MGAWDVVNSEDDMNAIRLTWEFKLNWYSDGLIKHFKSNLCACGDMKLEGIYLFETYASVVRWTTISLMLIIEVLLQLK